MSDEHEPTTGHKRPPGMDSRLWNAIQNPQSWLYDEIEAPRRPVPADLQGPHPGITYGRAEQNPAELGHDDWDDGYRADDPYDRLASEGGHLGE